MVKIIHGWILDRMYYLWLATCSQFIMYWLLFINHIPYILLIPILISLIIPINQSPITPHNLIRHIYHIVPDIILQIFADMNKTITILPNLIMKLTIKHTVLTFILHNIDYVLYHLFLVSEFRGYEVVLTIQFLVTGGDQGFYLVVWVVLGEVLVYPDF